MLRQFTRIRKKICWLCVGYASLDLTRFCIPNSYRPATATKSQLLVRLGRYKFLNNVSSLFLPFYYSYRLLFRALSTINVCRYLKWGKKLAFFESIRHDKRLNSTSLFLFKRIFIFFFTLLFSSSCSSRFLLYNI